MSDPASRVPRYQSLDAWRGVAALLVVVNHSTMFQYFCAPQGLDPLGDTLIAATARMWVGVPLFFVISGYCISATAEASRNRSVRNYYFRRIRRIYPPYWIALAVVVLCQLTTDAVVAPGLLSATPYPIEPVPKPNHLTGTQWVAGLTLTETWRPLIEPEVVKRMIVGQAWSLCYEEQFYFVTGLILILWPRRFLAACGVLTVLIAVGVLLRWGGLTVVGTFLDGRWLMFAAGVGVYYGVNRAGRTGSIAIQLCLLAGVIYAIRDPSRLIEYDWFYLLADGKELFAAFAFALFLLFVHRWDGVLAASWVGRQFGSVGRFSYSLYLIHYPICLALSHAAFKAGLVGAWPTLLLVLPLSVGLATLAGYVFYHLVEKRFLNPSHMSSRTQPCSAAPVPVAIPAIAPDVTPMPALAKAVEHSAESSFAKSG